MKLTPFQKVLREHKACIEARRWAGRRTVHEVWAECQRGDWMLWLATEANADKGAVRAAIRFMGCAAHLPPEEVWQSIAAYLEALSCLDRWLVLESTAQFLRRLISSQDIARGLGLGE